MNKLMKQPLKATVLKANKETAEKISADLLSWKTTSGKQIVKREDNENGFCLRIPLYVESGERKMCKVFIYTNNPTHKFEYDDRIITLF